MWITITVIDNSVSVNVTDAVHKETDLEQDLRDTTR